MKILVAVTAGLLLAAFPAPLPARAQGQPDILALLDQYAAGEFETVLAAFGDIDDVERAREALEDHGRAWVDAAGPADAARRRIAAATFALEFAEARMLDEWRRLRPLIKWGCGIVRDGEPTDAERTWHLASVALAQGARDWDVLYASPPPVTIPSYRHLAHAQDRFPSDVRWGFADAVVTALRHASGWPARGEPAPSRGPSADSVRSRFAAINYLQEFASHPMVGGEAELRTGVAFLRLLEPDDAHRHFDAASRSDDPFVAYLAHFFAGQLHERDGAPAQAIAAYRRALDVVPRAQSASLALSALLFARGDPDEAYALVRRAFDGPRPSDPWRLYGFGDYRRFGEYVAALRRELAS